MKKIFFSLFILACAMVSAQDNSAWSKYSFGSLCTLEIPYTMELRDASSTSGKFIDKGVAHFLLEFGEQLASKRIVFQPNGINSTNQEVYLAASEKYSRVIVELFPSGGLKQSDFDNLTELDMRELNNAYQEQYINDMYKMRYDIKDFKWFPLRRIKYSGKNALVTHYRRGGLKGQVDVTEYLFIHKDHQIRIIVSYRLSESNIWATDFEKIISTIKFK